MEYVALVLSIFSTMCSVIDISRIGSINKRLLICARKDDTLESIRLLERRMEFLEVTPQVRELLILRGQDPDVYSASYDYKGILLPSGEWHTPQEIRLLLKTTKEACCEKKTARKTKKNVDKK